MSSANETTQEKPNFKRFTACKQENNTHICIHHGTLHYLHNARRSAHAAHIRIHTRHATNLDPFSIRPGLDFIRITRTKNWRAASGCCDGKRGATRMRIRGMVPRDPVQHTIYVMRFMYLEGTRAHRLGNVIHRAAIYWDNCAGYPRTSAR